MRKTLWSGLYFALRLSLVIGFCLVWFTPGARANDPLDSWTLVNFPTNYAGRLNGVAYGNGRYVAAGAYFVSDLGFVVTSEDGLNWTLRTTNTPGNLTLD